MSTLEHAVRGALDAFNDRDYDRIGTFVTADFIDHGAPPGLVPPGPDGYVQILRFVGEALAVRYELVELTVGTASGVSGPGAERVTVRAIAHGTHLIDHMVPATGKPFSMPTMHLYRGDPASGLLAEHWAVRDELALLMQIGGFVPIMAFPPASESAPAS